MKTGELFPQPENRLLFKLMSIKSVPQKAGCYVITNYDNDILYIGLSDNLFKRFRHHLDNPQKTSPTILGKAIWFYYLVYDPLLLERLERTWLNQYESSHGQLPVLNKIKSPIK